MRPFRSIELGAVGCVLAVGVFLLCAGAPYVFEGRFGPLGFPWVFTSAVISQLFVLAFMVFIAVFVWRIEGSDGE